MFGIKMPWTKKREAREAAERAAYLKREQERDARRALLRTTWAKGVGGARPVASQSRSSETLNHLGNWPSPVDAPAADATAHQARYDQPAPMHGLGGTFAGGGASGDWASSSPASVTIDDATTTPTGND